MSGPQADLLEPRSPVSGWVRARREPHAIRKYGASKWHRAVNASPRGVVVETLCGRVVMWGEWEPDRPSENRFCAECMARWTKGESDAAGVA